MKRRDFAACFLYCAQQQPLQVSVCVRECVRAKERASVRNRVNDERKRGEEQVCVLLPEINVMRNIKRVDWRRRC